MTEVVQEFKVDEPVAEETPAKPASGLPAIDIENLKQKKLFIATPCYGGVNHTGYTKAMINLVAMFQGNGLYLHQPYFLINESLIPRARNYCAQAFLDTDCTHLMFIDSDIEFAPQDVAMLLQLCDENTDKDIVAGVYPKKNISWEKVKKAVEKGYADKNPNDLQNFVGDYVVGVVDDGNYKMTDLLPVSEAGTGFMMIKRSVLAKYAEAYPELSYYPDHKRSAGFDGSRKITAFFLDVLDQERHLSEDYMFCHWARKIGMKVWVAPWMKMIHYGTYPFLGNFPATVGAGFNPTLAAEDAEKAVS